MASTAPQSTAPTAFTAARGAVLGVKPVFLFPGPASCHPQMIERLLGWAEPDAAKTLELGSTLLGRDLRKHFTAGVVASRRNAFVALFVANHVHLLAVHRAGIRAERSVGLGLGEYNHLVQIGAIGFPDGLRLVDALGAACDDGPRGELHTADMASVAERLRPLLRRTAFRTARYPYLPTVLGQFEEELTNERYAELLALHVQSPVLFRASVDYLATKVPNPVFIEVGPGTEIGKLLGSGWRGEPRFSTDDNDNPARALTELAKELSLGA